jgi:hypothetical protein
MTTLDLLNRTTHKYEHFPLTLSENFETGQATFFSIATVLGLVLSSNFIYFRSQRGQLDACRRHLDMNKN